ncbi:hypothetical protein TRIATDRAFT_256073 [Trichoderma atroviride IMI 206040]|uniref:Uncharacterized protein n=1 Tax=Hypocrea atroviridis (strain ATCC 20476 / IMI 206040) TaxID=452589 RepID=G9NNZ6_HYPAI|nr:uncharacterized protein TRIATDRAFT_256073 [Trichoderma atroviride IMI 206040]EHK47783.1 hypothetical protein TRIATDRAFT_256073 [Trichoderma atroviride IMI 206040]
MNPTVLSQVAYSAPRCSRKSYHWKQESREMHSRNDDTGGDVSKVQLASILFQSLA